MKARHTFCCGSVCPSLVAAEHVIDLLTLERDLFGDLCRDIMHVRTSLQRGMHALVAFPLPPQRPANLAIESELSVDSGRLGEQHIGAEGTEQHRE